MFAKNLKYIPQTYSTVWRPFYSVSNKLRCNTSRLLKICNPEKNSSGISGENYNDELNYQGKINNPDEIFKSCSFGDNSQDWLTKMKMDGTFEKFLRNPCGKVLEYYNIIADLRIAPFLMIDSVKGPLFQKSSDKVKWLEETVFPIIKSSKRNTLKGTTKTTVEFLCQRSLMNSNGNLLLSGNNFSSFSGTVKYCTQGHTRRNGKKPKKMVNDDNSNEIYGQNESLLEFQDTRIRDEVVKLFPTPKNTLSNIYNSIKNEKGSHIIWLSPTYQQVKRKWAFTYKIKWPVETTFSYVADSKKIASSKCALLVLQYLLDTKYINNNGSPILYDKKDIQELIRGNIPALNFNKNHMEQLENITSLYSQQIFPIIEYSKNTTKLESEDEVLSNELRTCEQEFLGYDIYKSKEKVHLPISDYKEDIIQKIQQNRVLVVKGEPGCGKSTRVPQYILEAWAREAEITGKPCNIVVTEPRRIAAISLADRVASERDETVGQIVGYKVRFKANFQPKTGRIMYCTNGILLQHFKSDPNLSNFSHIVIDEAHERDINTDLLLNMLREVLNNNTALKVVIMSATIDTALFQKYFAGSSFINIPGFTYPVKSYFLDGLKLCLDQTKKMCDEDDPVVVHDEVVRTLMHIHQTKPEGAVLCFLPGWEDIRKIRDLIPDRQDVMVLCLHSRLQDLEQWRIFEKSPEGVRKIILATNIAETSVTINDVVYVVDTGIHKETRFDIERGSMCIDNHWISKSSVDQRKGRAGRVKAGECFHLYPKNKLETLPQFSLPEVLRVSLTKVVLDSKAFNSQMTALEFFNKLPSPPKDEIIKLAVDELVELELFDVNEHLTPLGRVLHHFQLEPKLAKTLVNSVIFKCVSPIVDIVTLFSSGTDIFRSGLERKEDIRNFKASFSKSSDHLSLMQIFEIWNEFKEDGCEQKAKKFSEDLSLVPSKMNLMKALKKIHLDYIRNGLKRNVLPISDEFSDDHEMVKATLLSGVGSFLSYRNWDVVKGRVKKNNVLLTRTNQKATVTPESVNFKNNSIKSKFLLYINETRSNMRRITLIRETSLIPAIMVLLFSNKELILEDIHPKQFSSQLDSEDQVIMKLDGTKISFLLDREQALKIMECKLALTSCYNYYIFQLTEGGKRNPTLDSLWTELLDTMKDFLNDFKNE